MTENEIGTKIVNTSYHIYEELGVGLLESVYQRVLSYELRKEGLEVKTEFPIPVKWKQHIIEGGFKADLLVENKVIIELKSVEEIKKVHQRQTTTYVKLANLKLGYLINFGSPSSENLIQRIANGL